MIEQIKNGMISFPLEFLSSSFYRKKYLILKLKESFKYWACFKDYCQFFYLKSDGGILDRVFFKNNYMHIEKFLLITQTTLKQVS